VSNVVEIVKEEHRRGRPYGTHGNRYHRGRNHTFIYRFRKIDVVCYKRTFFDRNCAGVEFAVGQELRIALSRAHRDVTNLNKYQCVYQPLNQKPTKTECFSYQILFISLTFEQNNIQYLRTTTVVEHF
jgi:hypothetical protein